MKISAISLGIADRDGLRNRSTQLTLDAVKRIWNFAIEPHLLFSIP
ncbi:hypothetical protein [Chamaesiphon sp. VAR_69_metabat_338]|nr:hypothetical protein [Chamaesiphon sp. VAR_69_metabat_338]